jgi:hypothetical protein
MAKTRKNLGPDEIARLRARIEEAQHEIRELIAFLQSKLDARKA